MCTVLHSDGKRGERCGENEVARERKRGGERVRERMREGDREIEIW